MKKTDDNVTIVEISPRDGLPAVCKGVSTEDKVAFINKLSETGLQKIEVASFTHPRLLPRNSDAEEVIEGIKKRSRVNYVGLVPNEIGCRRSIITKIDEILFLVAASDLFNELNVGRTLKETMNKVLPAVTEAVRKSGKSIRIYVLTAFGCPYTGTVPPEAVLQLILKLDFMKISEIVLVDSTGMANPVKVKSMIKSIVDLNLNAEIAVHFHNTRGAAIANCVAAYEAGIRIFDTSLGGMSGTPYGAMELDLGYWNVPTEDLVHLFEDMGVSTGIDLGKLLECVTIAEKLAGKRLPGHILRAKPGYETAKIPSYIKMQKYIDM